MDASGVVCNPEGPQRLGIRREYSAESTVDRTNKHLDASSSQADNEAQSLACTEEAARIASKALTTCITDR